MNSPRMTPETMRLAGHRGHSAGAPENTFAAFRMAREIGGPGITCETDLAMSSDGEFFLLHDDTVDRTTNGHGLVQYMTSAEIAALDAGSWFGKEFAGEPVPRLRDALLFARENDILYQLEIKTYNRNEEIFPRLKALIEELDCADLLQFSSFDFVLLRELKRAIPGIPTVGLSHSRLIDPAALARDANVDAINLEIEHFASGEALQLHEAGYAAFLHVPRPEVLDRLSSYGYNLRSRLIQWIRDGWMDQIICDNVSLMVSLKEEAHGA